MSNFSFYVLLISSDSGTGTIRDAHCFIQGAHGTIQVGAKSDKIVVSSISLPVSVISADSETGTVWGAHGVPMAPLFRVPNSLIA